MRFWLSEEFGQSGAGLLSERGTENFGTRMQGSANGTFVLGRLDGC